MAIILFTDFGADDLYVGQVEAMLDRYAPGVRVIDLLHEAPPFNVRAAAHLLAALAHGLPRGHVFLGVVDPGVGSERGAVVLRADGRWYVGPDNGLFSVAAAVATDDFPDENVAPAAGLEVDFGADDLAEVIYVDHYGNAFTGIRARGISPERMLVANGREARHARVFADVPPGAAFWYENSSGLVEIAVNQGHAGRTLW